MSAFDLIGFGRASRLRPAGAGGLLPRLAGLLRLLRRRRVTHLTRQQLEALSDWQLKDIGLHRSEIWSVAHSYRLGLRHRGHGEG